MLVAAALAACGDEHPEGAARQGVGTVERLLAARPTPLPASAVEAVETRLARQVERGAFAGAALAVGNRDMVQKVVALGRTHWADDAPPVHPRHTLYDLASLTKVVATTAAVMALVEDGRMRLDAPVRRYVPEFAGGLKDRVTIRQLLTHTSGMRAGALHIEGETARQARRFLLSLPLALEPGQDVLYSDLGFVLLWTAAERAAGEPLSAYLRRRIWLPLGMRSTAVGLAPGCQGCAPTLYLEERDEPYTGGSYDEVARRLDGAAGNAGAFSTVHDLARFAAMIANEGRLGDVRVLQRATVRAFTRPQPHAGTRALGWEVYCREGVVPDHRPCEEVYAFGHSGATGTSLWIDPRGRSWMVLLTNRTYLPRAEVDMQQLRRHLFQTLLGD